ncbi:MAG: divergent PAP2 family protein [Lachnospiraceae bacterium]|nr:divergent PAP2 family protein [Lachnospiraceae bacterium]MBQ6637045.1 divergent PAP2 family protein [Lachnospiraceae bacterium]MBR3636548.1 divergent PAP2 family protein [Lachnospiraceae bacterium]
MVRNEVLMSAILSWMLAQIIKTIIHLFETRKFVPERLIGSGGMPSCHSAAMCALTTSILINEGISSTYLAIAAVMSVVVMYDAMGVRRETGIHSAVLNEIISDYREAGKELTPVEKMREFMGHTPLQVLVGALLGIAFALLYCLVIIR